MPNNNSLDAAVAFLNNYADEFGQRKELILSLESKAEKYRPAVEEFNKVQQQISILRSQNKSSEKFLINMKEMLGHNEIGIGKGPLFETEPVEGKDENKN